MYIYYTFNSLIPVKERMHDRRQMLSLDSKSVASSVHPGKDTNVLLEYILFKKLRLPPSIE